MHIILGAGKNQRIEGWKTQDQFDFEGIDYVFDLNKDWPLEDDSVTGIIAVQVIEHLNSFIHFHNEAWRVLKPGGTLYLETPNAHGLTDLIWSDPTHIRPYTPHSWINYLTIDGIAKFGYTDKCWGSLHIETRNGVIVTHIMPIK